MKVSFLQFFEYVTAIRRCRTGRQTADPDPRVGPSPKHASDLLLGIHPQLPTLPFSSIHGGNRSGKLVLSLGLTFLNTTSFRLLLLPRFSKETDEPAQVSAHSPYSAR
jgi:hypothetical protein